MAQSLDGFNLVQHTCDWDAFIFSHRYYNSVRSYSSINSIGKVKKYYKDIFLFLCFYT